MKDVQSPETYIVMTVRRILSRQAAPFTTSLTFMWRECPLNEWGSRKMDDRRRACRPRPERRQYRLQVHARDLHLVLGPGRTVSRSIPRRDRRRATRHQPRHGCRCRRPGIVTGSGFISSSGRAALSPITRSRFRFLDPGVQPTHLPSADIGASDSSSLENSPPHAS